MPTFRPARQWLLYGGVTACLIGGATAVILQVTDSWSLGKVLGRFQQGCIVGVTVSLLMLADESRALGKLDSHTVEHPEPPFASLPMGVGIEPPLATILRVSLFCSIFVGAALMLDALTVVGMVLGFGLVALLAYKLLVGWETSHQIHLFYPRKLLWGRKNPHMYLRPS